MESNLREGQARSAWAWNNLWKKEKNPQDPHPPFRKFFNIFKSNKDSLKGKALPCVIEIDSTSLKFAQITTHLGTSRISKIAYVPLAEDQRSPQETKKILEKILRANMVRGRVIALLPQSAVRVFSCSLPNMPEQEIDQAIAWKLKQGLPSDLQFENLTFDYIWYGGPADAQIKEIRALVFYAQRSLTESQMQLYRSLSLELAAIEPQPYCVYLLLDWFGAIPQEANAMIIWIGPDESSVVMTQSGRPCLIRPLSVSGNGWTSAVAAYHRMDPAKAQELRTSEGLLSPEGESLCMKALSGQLESLVVELEHAARFMPRASGSAQNIVFEKILLSGEAAAMRGLDKFLSEKLSTPVELIDPLTNGKLRLPDFVGEHVMENSYDFCAVLGAAAGYLQ